MGLTEMDLTEMGLTEMTRYLLGVCEVQSGVDVKDQGAVGVH